jgi:hypothetical protein
MGRAPCNPPREQTSAWHARQAVAAWNRVQVRVSTLLNV